MISARAVLCQNTSQGFFWSNFGQKAFWRLLRLSLASCSQKHHTFCLLTTYIKIRSWKKSNDFLSLLLLSFWTTELFKIHQTGKYFIKQRRGYLAKKKEWANPLRFEYQSCWSCEKQEWKSFSLKQPAKVLSKFQY